MSTFRLIFGFGVLVLVSLFLSANIETLDTGTGYQYLMLAGVFSVILFLFTKRFEIFVRYRKSLLILVIFFGYMVLNLVIDIQNIDQIKAQTIGTSGGVIFAFVLGLILSFVISDFYLIMVKSRKLAHLSGVLIIGYLCLLLWLFVESYQVHLTNVRDDVFLVTDQDAKYQRAGNFIYMQIMLAGALVALLCSLQKTVNGIFILVGVVIFMSISVVGMLLSQIIGSNSGFATTVGFLLLLLSYVYISRARVFHGGQFLIGHFYLIFGWLGKKIFAGTTVVSMVLFGSAVVLVSILSFDVSNLKIFGFGSGSISSITSRIEILRNNFIEQFSYSPLFGNTQVELLTSGEGKYLHSLLSILTHLGLVGFLIFSVLLVQMYLEITKYKSNSYNLFTDVRYSLFRLFSMILVLGVALLTAFYTWMPLWFAIGLFGVALGGSKKYCENIV